MNICIFCKIAVMLAKKNAFFEAFFFYVSRWPLLLGHPTQLVAVGRAEVSVALMTTESSAGAIRAPNATATRLLNAHDHRETARECRLYGCCWSEVFAEFGGSAAFGFAEKAVEMADRVEAARKADFGNGQFGVKQHTTCYTEPIVIEIAVRCASCFVFKKTRESVRIHANHFR